MKKIKLLIIIVMVIAVIVAVTGYFLYQNLFGAPQGKAKTEQVIVPLSVSDSNQLVDFLKGKGFIKNDYGYKFAFFKVLGSHISISKVSNTVCQDCFLPGAYKLSKSMNAWEVANAIKSQPYMKWIVLPEGWRKEQMAEALASTLGWSYKEKSDWATRLTALDNDHIEGVYFPDTYLIPVDETPSATADRLRKKFETEFAPFAQDAIKQNVKWTTLVKIASIIQREAAGKDDMPLISGIIWNRLLADKRLEIDATVQYIVDTKNNYNDDGYVGEYARINGWWRPIKASDISSAKSPYNTYLNSGLPPQPICNPGLEAIKAALYPAQTECFFYLHDSSGNIHCAKTYAEHLANIDKYLK
jgi:UPF0755 protein